jgi:MFS family permease
MFACFGGWALDAMDVQLFSFVIPTLLVAWSMTKAEAGFIGTATLVVSALGGIVSGILIDRFGRVRILQLTVLTYALCNGLCGFAQNAQQLTILRALEGFGFGGEWAAGSVLICEVIRDKYRGRAGGIVQSGWAIGWAAAVIIYTVVFVPEALAWRTLFWVGLLPALLVFYVRRHVKEPDIFQKKKEMATAPTGSQFFTLFNKKYLFTTLVLSVMTTGAQGESYILNIWLPTYLRVERGMSVLGTGSFTFVAIVGAWAGFIVGAYLSDSVGRKATFMISAIGSAAMVSAYMLLPLSRNVMLLMGFLMGAFAYMMFSPMGPYLSEMFPTNIRGTGQGFCYSFGRGVGAFFPWLIGIYSMKWRLSVAIVVFCLIAYALMIIALLMLPETKGRNLEAAFDEGGNDTLAKAAGITGSN